MGEGVFNGLKVADFSWNAVGPISTRYLAHQGATVIKIETSASPDASRFVPPYKDDKVGIDRSTYWTDFNTNKYGLALNLNHPRAKEVAIKLIKWADVVAESYSVGVMGKWGLNYEEARKIKPDIIMYSATMQGQTGPHCNHPGFGFNLVALCGFSHLLGYSDSGPLQVHGAYTDYVAPRFGALALIAALDYRRRTGKGQYIDLSQFECSIEMLAPMFLEYSANKRVLQRQGNRSTTSAPHGAFRCLGEDEWCVIAVCTEREWQAFCSVTGHPSLSAEPRFRTLADRKRNEDELDRYVEEWTINRTPEEVMVLMQQAGVPAGIVASGEDLLKDPQLKHRHHFTSLEHPEIGRHSCQGISFNLSRTPGKITKAAPCLGQDTAYVCTQLLGMADTEFAELSASGALT